MRVNFIIPHFYIGPQVISKIPRDPEGSSGQSQESLYNLGLHMIGGVSLGNLKVPLLPGQHRPPGHPRVLSV